MSYSQIQNSVARSFYFVVTCFFKFLLFVDVPFVKKYSYKTPHAKPEPDLPPPILKKSKNKLLWSQIIALREKNGIKVKPINHRVKVLNSYHCPDSYASSCCCPDLFFRLCSEFDICKNILCKTEVF